MKHPLGPCLLTLLVACVQSNAIDLDVDAGDAEVAEDGGGEPEPQTRRLQQETRDDFCDQRADEITTLEYDDQNRLKGRTVKRTGSPMACVRLVYDDESGLLKAERTDDGCDGVVDECISHEYDEDGHELSRTADQGCDGEIEFSTVRTYNAEGLEETVRSDILAFSRPISGCSRTEYDDAGRAISIESDDCDGGAHECSVLTYDAADHVLTQHTEPNCDDTIRSNCFVNVYRGDGQLAFSTFDDDCDGFPGGNCTRTEHRYDGAGNELEERVDESCNGTTDECSSFEYDDAGNRTASREDLGCDAVPETCVAYAYE